MAIARYFDASKHETGQFIPGVPLRDITDEEWATYPDDIQASVDRAPFFRKTKPDTAATRRAAEKEAD